jgi:PAS domain S-box-containing protein
MTIGNGTVATTSPNQTLGQFISALTQEVPDPELLMRIVDRVPLGVAIVRGSELRYTLVNAAYAAIPPAPDGILGRTVADVFPTMPAAALALLEKVCTTGETFSVRGHQAATDLGRGPTFWDIDFIGLPETRGDERGTAEKGVLIIARDVTRQILSERAGESLRATEARLNIALEAADLGAWSARNYAEEFICSPHAAVMHGLAPDAAVDHATALSVIHPDDRAAVEAAVERAIADKGTLSVEYRVVRPEGSGGEAETERWIASRGRWIEDSFNSGGQLFGVVRDITGRKKAEAERERLITRMAGEQARFKALMESLPAGVLVAEAPDGRIAYGNHRVEEILRHPVLPLPNVDAYGEWVAWHPDGRLVEPAQWPLARALKGEFIAADEFLYRRGDGTTGWIRVSGSPVVDAAGTVIGSVVVLYDVDREKQAESALRSSEERVRSVLDEKEALLAQKDMLLKEVNHRVKNSLQLVASLLNLQGRQLDDSRSRQAFEDAVSRVGAIAQVHEQLYKTDDVTRVEFGSYLRTLCTLYGGEGGVAVDAATAEIPTDAAIPLGLLAVELLTNALKHAGPGTSEQPIEIFFGYAERETGGMGSDAGLLLTVRDHGPGIAPQFLEARSRRRSESLGMRLIESLASQIDARLDVENLDPGARWTLKLPFSR